MYFKVVFVFYQKHFRTSYVCPTQTTRRRLSLQCVCFLEVLSLKKVFKTSSSNRRGLVSSRVFYPLLPLRSFKTSLITLMTLVSSRHISISTSVEPSPPFSRRHLHPADTSIDLHLHHH
ncbi:hypothetical protein Hanom_Chr14g01313521 [Helianthus anomalus]